MAHLKKSITCLCTTYLSQCYRIARSIVSVDDDDNDDDDDVDDSRLFLNVNSTQHHVS